MFKYLNWMFCEGGGTCTVCQFHVVDTLQMHPERDSIAVKWGWNNYRVLLINVISASLTGLDFKYFIISIIIFLLQRQKGCQRTI